MTRKAFILTFFFPTSIFFFSADANICTGLAVVTFNVKNMEIDLSSNIPQLMLGALFFQGGTERWYISPAKYMIILKLP